MASIDIDARHAIIAAAAREAQPVKAACDTARAFALNASLEGQEFMKVNRECAAVVARAQKANPQS